MDISPRTPIIVTEPAPWEPAGRGTSRRWSRTINGRPYSFTAVTMPDGERRYFVSRYNGYLSDANGLPTPGATKWGCAWSPAHEWIVAPSTATEDNRMIATNTAEDEVRIFQALCTERDRLAAARARAVELRDVVIARGHPVGSIENRRRAVADLGAAIEHTERLIERYALAVSATEIGRNS